MPPPCLEEIRARVGHWLFLGEIGHPVQLDRVLDEVDGPKIQVRDNEQIGVFRLGNFYSHFRGWVNPLVSEEEIREHVGRFAIVGAGRDRAEILGLFGEQVELDFQTTGIETVPLSMFQEFFVEWEPSRPNYPSRFQREWPV